MKASSPSVLIVQVIGLASFLLLLPVMTTSAFVVVTPNSVRTTWNIVSGPIATTQPSAAITTLIAPPPISTSTSTSSLQALPAAAAAAAATALTTTLPAALTALPLSQKIFLSCFLPTCLGFWRSEYGVSYAYGTATALTSYWIYKALIVASSSSATTMAAASKATTTVLFSNSLATWHAGALMFYGIRLCLFLLYRELFTKRMKESVKRIEAKATARGSRLKRTPFVVSCAGLYFGLCAPLLITSQLQLLKTAGAISNQWILTAMKTLVSLTWGGFIFAALGDFHKSLIKAIKGEDHLVTGGLFQFCRHPNYTGEIISWTSNGLLAILAAIVLQTTPQAVTVLSVPRVVGYVVASVVGALGLNFVLVQATGGLEKRQKETYGSSKDYQRWVETSWPGFQMPVKAVDEVVVTDNASHVPPEIEVVDTTDEGGSGI